MELLLKHFEEMVQTEEDVEALKQKILDLAIRGKLVPQDPNDEPASVLLERIEEEKERLMKEKKIRRFKRLPEITQEEEPYELSDNWSWSRLGNLANFIDYRGKTPKKTTSGVKLITAKNVKNNYLSLNPKEYIAEEDYDKWMVRGFPRYGDILFTTEAPIGHVAQLEITTKVALAQRIITLQPSEEIYKPFLKYVLLSPTIHELILAKATGTTAKGIKSSNLKLILIPIPPLHEQKRIVDKINELFTLCDQLYKDIQTKKQTSDKLNTNVFSRIQDASNPSQKEDLSFAIKHMEDLCHTKEDVDLVRQSLLSLAIQGKLVKQDPNDEPASILLENIEREKERLVEEEKIRKPKKLPDITEEPYELPKGWEWVKIGSIFQVNPRNNLEDETKVSFVPMKFIDDGFVNNHKSEMKVWKEVKSGVTHFKEDDIAIAKITPCFENRKSVIFKDLINGYGAGTTELHILRKYENYVLPEYFLYLFKSQEFISGGVNTYTGTAGQQRVKKEFIENYVVGLPPLSEQVRIIKTIEELFHMCDVLENNLERKSDSATKLRDSILNSLTNNNEEFFVS